MCEVGGGSASLYITYYIIIISHALYEKKGIARWLTQRLTKQYLNNR